jgi:hypothetical protein
MGKFVSGENYRSARDFRQHLRLARGIKDESERLHAIDRILQGLSNWAVEKRPKHFDVITELAKPINDESVLALVIESLQKGGLNGDRSTVGRPKLSLCSSTTVDLSPVRFPLRVASES